MGTHQKKNNKISYSAEELREIPFIFKKLKVDGIFCILEQNMHSNRELKGIVAMVDSNLHRENLKPSEKAYAYKMKLEAMNRQGKRYDLTSDRVGPKLTRGNELLAKEVGESVTMFNYFFHIMDVIFIDDTCLIYSRCNLIDIICGIGK